ncbi:MAG: glycosyltransferase, partial [Bacteroidales bacterium]|nr:glycosyltransferase [Bacteroidales bacterium]
MNIMLINHYAGSPQMGMEYRPYYLAKEWISKGHKVVVIAADNAHVRKIQPIIFASFTSESIDGIEYLWVKTPEYQGNGIARVKNMFSFVSQLNRKASFLSRKYRPDVVIASSTYPLDNYPAHKIAKLSGAIYMYEIHDLWPLSPM